MSMLINVRNDLKFQKFLDFHEQRLHVQMAPLLLRAIRIQLNDGDTNAHAFIVQRGEKILVAHYKKIFRAVYTSIEPVEKDARGIGDFMARMLGFIETEGATKIVDIATSLTDAIRAGIQDGVQQGWSNAQIEREIMGEADDMSRTRAATIARTETHSASTWAMDESIDEKEIEVITKTWWTAGDARVRDSHAGMHGVEIPRDEAFSLDGGDLMYPGDDSLGADAGELINCRCSVLYSTPELEI